MSTETTRVTPLDTFSLLTRTDALDTKDTVGRSRTRIEQVSASLGTSVTRLEIASRALSECRIAEAAAISRILDADIGFEASELARRTILQRSAQAILAQANVSSDIALKLLAP